MSRHGQWSPSPDQPQKSDGRTCRSQSHNGEKEDAPLMVAEAFHDHECRTKPQCARAEWQEAVRCPCSYCSKQPEKIEQDEHAEKGPGPSVTPALGPKDRCGCGRQHRDHEGVRPPERPFAEAFHQERAPQDGGTEPRDVPCGLHCGASRIDGWSATCAGRCLKGGVHGQDPADRQVAEQRSAQGAPPGPGRAGRFDPAPLGWANGIRPHRGALPEAPSAVCPPTCLVPPPGCAPTCGRKVPH